MKILFSILGLAFVVMIAITLQLVQKGAALRPAGVIKPVLIPEPPSLIGQSLALRLFPHFQSSERVYWISSEDLQEVTKEISQLAFQKLRLEKKPHFILRNLAEEGEQALEKDSILIYVVGFRRDQGVPSHCETQHVLDLDCLIAVSAREVRKKLTENKPYFFMRRYFENRFYLLIEKS
ncbi:MAG: hypothetical protein ACK5RO_00125 [Pseudobdellovibrionaceae bacterium]|jgi:hypothetical protein